MFPLCYFWSLGKYYSLTGKITIESQVEKLSVSVYVCMFVVMHTHHLFVKYERALSVCKLIVCSSQFHLT